SSGAISGCAKKCQDTQSWSKTRWRRSSRLAPERTPGLTGGPFSGDEPCPPASPPRARWRITTMKTVALAGARTPRRHLSQVLGASWVLMCSLASLLPCLAQPNAVRDGKPDFTRVRKFIQEQIVATTVPSVAVAVARRGEILWEEGFGWADRENRVP